MATDESLASDSPSLSPKRRNRLAIGHLLLWMVTTGVALVCLQANKPQPPETIGFPSFLTGAGITAEELKAEMDKHRLEIWREWNAHYVAGLFFAPVYGMALAGVALALWRVATRRFGFPVQPGHWLLILIAGLASLVVAHPLMRLLPLTPDGADFVQMAIMATIAVAITVVVREPQRWRYTLALASSGIGMVCLGYVAGFVSQSSIGPPPAVGVGFGLGGLAIAIFPLAAVACAAWDVGERGRYDIFHWVGVVTLLGVAIHVVAV